MSELDKLIKVASEFSELINAEITIESAHRCVELIRLMADDDEVAHGMEDEFREAILKQLDSPLAKIALSTSNIKFSRWCA
jgi:hypothetical protein